MTESWTHYVSILLFSYLESAEVVLHDSQLKIILIYLILWVQPLKGKEIYFQVSH